jgi:hypothetical protein
VDAQCGLRSNKSAIALGAQAERRGDAEPARSLLGSKRLTGRCSFAEFPYLLVRILTPNRAIRIRFVMTLP